MANSKFSEILDSLSDKTVEDNIENKKLTDRQIKSRINKIINIFKEHAIENNDMKLNSFMMVTKTGSIGVCPIPVSMIHSSMGEMMMKGLVKEYNKNPVKGELYGFLELQFVRGLIKKADSKEEAEADLNKLKKMSVEELINYKELEDYMVANIYTHKNLKMNIFDIIQIEDRQGKPTGEGFVISPKCKTEEEMDYDNKRFINYFK